VVVRDGLLVAGRDLGLPMELALALVEFLFGPEKAAAVAAPMVVADQLAGAAA